MIKRYARVIDNVDPDQEGQIQVRPIPEGNGWEEDKLPWARPVDVGVPSVSEGVGKHNVPAIGSVIAVYVSDDWQDYDYINEAPSVSDWYPYKSMNENLDIPYLDDQEYPEPHFTKTPDGTIVFHNQTSGEMGIQHPTGLFVVIDKTGNMYVRFVNEMAIHNEDESVKLYLDGANSTVEVTAGTFKFTGDEFTVGTGADNVALFTPLEKILKELIKAKVIAPTGPSSPLVDSSLSPLEAKLASEIPKIKSEMNTSD